VDQTVQRSPDGGEERTIAKTVSLMLTPEQASKLSLAEQIGEVSLIPRNPDDDAIASWAEMKIEDLLGDGDANNREKEQGVAEGEPENHGSLIGAIAAVPPKPPFRMEIVEAQAVREMLFDVDTGRPIRQMVEEPVASGPSVSPSLSPGTAIQGDASAAEALDDFPIDLDTEN
jgi:hypothetical protein